MSYSGTGVSTFSNVFANGTPGQSVNVVESTLMAVQQQQEIARRPLKVPDLREFGVGRRLNTSA